MKIELKKSAPTGDKEHLLIFADKFDEVNGLNLLSKEEKSYVKDQNEKQEKNFVSVNQYNRWIFIQFSGKKQEAYKQAEALRKAGNDVAAQLNARKIGDINIHDVSDNKLKSLAFIEGIALGNYQYLKYFTDAKKKANSLSSIRVSGANLSKNDIAELGNIVEATRIARDLVNEVPCAQTATKLSKDFEKLGKEAGFKVEVLTKTKIEALKMGGVLAVNRGSLNPPTFTIMEYKPKNAKNKKPYILVGKGIVFDTGGLSLKPTPNSMDHMKSDMAGAAAVAGAMYALAKNQLPVHVIALVPATDNRPGVDAYVPGDVITLHNGKTVEVLNTDAEGRLILGDALSYAQKYKPQLVIDLATLTGAAVAAVGSYATVAMGTADEVTFDSLMQSGFDVYERLVRMPFWDEYGELIKSDVADIKNIGGPYAGSITAGKFLEHFIDYPWIHLDIAGPSFLNAKDAYRPKGGTGVGVRLLYNFLKTLSK